VKIFVDGHLLFTAAAFRRLKFSQVITSTDAPHLMPLNELLVFTRHSGKCTWTSSFYPAATLSFDWYVDFTTGRMQVVEQSITGNFLLVDKNRVPYNRYRMDRLLSLWVAMYFDPRRASVVLHPIDPTTVDLTVSEIDILRWAARGKTAWETAQIVGESERTIKFRRNELIKKMGAVNMVQAAVLAYAQGKYRL